MARWTLELDWDLRRAIAEALVRERIAPRRVFLFSPGREALAPSRASAWLQGEGFRCALLLAEEPPAPPETGRGVPFSAYRKTPAFASELQALLERIPEAIAVEDACGELRPVELTLPSGRRVVLRWRADGGIAFADARDGRVLRDLGP